MMKSSFAILEKLNDLEHIKNCMNCQIRYARIRHQLEGIDRCIRDKVGKG